MSMSSILKQVYHIHRSEIKELQEEIKSLKEQKYCQNCRVLEREQLVKDGRNMVLIGQYKLKIAELEERLLSLGVNPNQVPLQDSDQIALDIGDETNPGADDILVPSTPESSREETDSSEMDKRILATMIIPETLFPTQQWNIQEHAANGKTRYSQLQAWLNSELNLSSESGALEPLKKAVKIDQNVDSKSNQSKESTVIVPNVKLKPVHSKSLSRKQRRVNGILSLNKLEDQKNEETAGFNISNHLTYDPDETRIIDQPILLSRSSKTRLDGNENYNDSEMERFHQERILVPDKSSQDRSCDSQDLLEAIAKPSPPRSVLGVRQENHQGCISISSTPREQSFDRLPPPVEANHKYKESPVRKQDEREKLRGFDCPCCAAYFQGLSEDEKKKRLKECSRHRGNFSPDPNTPPHFWEVAYPSTIECKKRGLLNETQKVQLKSRRKKPNKPMVFDA